MAEEKFEFRQILPEDKVLMKAGLQKLSPESIRQRFFANKKEFSEEELKFLTEVDQVNHLAYVAIHKDDNTSPCLVGVIRAIRNLERPHFAELAITIADTYQGMGLGTKLLDKISERAQNVGIDHFYGDYNTNNLKMVKLLEKFSKNKGPLSLKHKGDGFIYFEAPLKNC